MQIIDKHINKHATKKRNISRKISEQHKEVIAKSAKSNLIRFCNYASDNKSLEDIQLAGTKSI